MRAIFICPTNREFMPYINLYGEVGCRAIYLIWDRFGDKALKGSDVVYRDKKSGHRRSFFDYLLYFFFVARWLILNIRVDDRVLIFGPQLVFFLWPIIFFKKITSKNIYKYL